MYHLPNHTQCRSSNVLFSLLLSVHFGSVYMVDSKTERKSLSSYCLELGHLHQVCYIQWTFLFNTKKTRKYIKLWYHRLVVGGYYRDSNFFNAHTRTHTHWIQLFNEMTKGGKLDCAVTDRTKKKMKEIINCWLQIAVEVVAIYDT